MTHHLTGGGAGPALGRVLASFDPAEYERLVTIPLRDCIEYLGKRSVTAKHEELKS